MFRRPDPASPAEPAPATREVVPDVVQSAGEPGDEVAGEVVVEVDHADQVEITDKRSRVRMRRRERAIESGWTRSRLSTRSSARSRSRSTR